MGSRGESCGACGPVEVTESQSLAGVPKFTFPIVPIQFVKRHIEVSCSAISWLRDVYGKEFCDLQQPLSYFCPSTKVIIS